MPPSTFSSLNGTSATALASSTTSRLCHAVASSAARAMCPWLAYAVRPDDHAARVIAPVGREQPGEGGDEVDAAVVLDGARQILDFRGALDQLQAVAQPLDQRAR